MLIDHHQQNIETLRKLLTSSGYKIHTALSRDEMAEALQNVAYDVAVVHTGTDFIERKNICERLRISDANRDTAVIFIAQAYDIDELVECFDAGGDDYLAKPINPDELLKRIAYHAAKKQQIDQMRYRNEKLASIATIDPLTKISSRIHMQTQLQQHIQLFNRYAEAASILYIRILELNRVNMLIGYSKGDRLIVHFVNALKETIRSSDSFGRWIGGDFVLLLPKTDAASARTLAVKINGMLSRDELFGKFSVRFGFGITEIVKDDTPAGVVERSRSALQRVADHDYERIAVL